MAATFYLFTTAICVFFLLKISKRVQVVFPLFFLISTIGFVHGFVPFSHELSGYYDHFSIGVRISSAIFTFFSTGAFLLGANFYFNRERLRESEKCLANTLSYLESEHLTALAIFLFGCSLLIGIGAFLTNLMVLGLSFGDFISAGRFEFRDGNRLLVVLGYFIQLIPCAFFYLGFIFRKFRLIGWVIAIAFSLVVAYLFKGSRIFAFSFVLCLASSFIFQSKGLSVKNVIQLIVSALFLIVFSIYVYEARKIVSTASLQDLFSLALDTNLYLNAFETDPFNYNVFMLNIVDSVPGEIDYQPFATIRRILFFPVPHELFPYLKPADPNHLLGTMFGGVGVTIPPGLIGHAYVEYFGYFGVFAMFAYGVAFSWISRFVVSCPFMLLSSGAACGISLLIISRGAYYESVIVFLFLSVLFGVFLKLAESLGVARLIRHYKR